LWQVPGLKPSVKQDPSEALQEIAPHGRIRKLQTRLHADAVHTAGGSAVPDCVIVSDGGQRCDEQPNRESEHEQVPYTARNALLPEDPLGVAPWSHDLRNATRPRVRFRVGVQAW
jgi:hypothetical protein